MNSDVRPVNSEAWIAIDVRGDRSIPRPGRRALALVLAASGACGAVSGTG
jgi:hypothetical protein